MRGRQVAAVGAEAEDDDVAIASSLEAGDLLIIGDAANRDRPIAEPQGITGHGGVEAGVDSRRGGRWMTRPVGLTSGRAMQAMASSRSAVDLFGGNPQLAADASGLGRVRRGCRTAGPRGG